MQIPHVYLFMAFLTLACRQPDRQSPAGPTVRATAGESASGLRDPMSETPPAHGSACVIAMSDEPSPQAAAADNCPKAPEPSIELMRGQVTFDDAPSRPRIEVEIVRTDETRQRGLMYRTKLAPEAGMLFVWDDESTRAFWMHNTCIPLDMLFISRDRVISGVVEQVPVLNDQPRGVRCPAAYVLEVNAGWVRGHQVKPGQHLTIAMP